MPRKIYKTNYIAEAVCEVRCDVGTSDDIALYEFYNCIKSKFPLRESIQNFQIHLGKGAPKAEELPATPKMRFVSQDRQSLVQAGFGVISISYLQYPDWNPFFEDIRWVIDQYFEQMGVVKKISRVGLRYINKINLPKSHLTLSTYFNIAMNFPTTFSYIKSFDLTVVNEIKERLVNVKFASGNQSKEDKSPILILDIDCHSGTTLNMSDIKRLYPYLDDTHTILKEVFESSITEDTRKDILRGYVSK